MLERGGPYKPCRYGHLAAGEIEHGAFVWSCIGETKNPGRSVNQVFVHFPSGHQVMKF